LKKHENPSPASGVSLAQGVQLLAGPFLKGPAAIVDHCRHSKANLVANVDSVIGPVKALKRPLIRRPVLARFRIVFTEADAVFDGFHFFAGSGFPRALQQEATTARDKITWSPRDESVITVGVNSDLDCYCH